MDSRRGSKTVDFRRDASTFGDSTCDVSWGVLKLTISMSRFIMCFRHLLKKYNFTTCFEGVESRFSVIYDADFLKCETVWRKTYVSEPTQSQAERSQVEPARARHPGRDRPPGRAARHPRRAEGGRASSPRARAAIASDELHLFNKKHMKAPSESAQTRSCLSMIRTDMTSTVSDS